MEISITPSPFGSVTVTLDGELGGVLQASILATSNSVLNMDLGVPGPAGATGSQGPAGTNGTNGVGVAAGGTTGQALVKLSGTNYDTGWATISGGGGTWGSITGTLSSQTDLYNALNGKLSLTGGTMSGDIVFPVDNNGNDALLGAFGYGVENTNGQVAYIQPDVFRIYDNSHLTGTSVNGAGITFNDSTVQVTSALPLTGGTMTGTLTLMENPIIFSGDGTGIEFSDGSTQSTGALPLTGGTLTGAVTLTDVGTGGIFLAGGDLQIYNDDASSVMEIDYEKIRFPNNTNQYTAWEGYNGTTSQYVRGDGSLYTFPPVGDRYLTSSTTTLTVDSGNGKTMTIGTGLSYSPQQDITVSYNTANHMHGTVLTYNSTTGVMTWDSNTHSGSGTYSNWEVNVGGVAGAVLPVGGTAGQVLAKINSTNFNTEWISLGSMAQATTTDYLAKADNLSGLASTTTARTNLGLGTMATATATDYLAKADNLSGLASASTARTNLGLGTAATQTTATFLQTANNLSDVTASTARTNLGLGTVATDAYATTTQAQAGTLTTTVINPSTLLDAKYFSGGKSAVQITWSTGTSGTGASAGAQNANGRLNVAPTSATGYAIAGANLVNTSRGLAFGASVDFSKRVQLGLRVARNVASPDSNSVWRYSIGKSVGVASAGDLSVRGLMIKVAGSGALQLLVHNGTSLTTTTSTYTPANSTAYDVVVVSDGAGNVTLYVNGTSVATSTGGPTSSSGGSPQLTFEVENTSTLTGSPQNICISDYYLNVNV